MFTSSLRLSVAVAGAEPCAAFWRRVKGEAKAAAIESADQNIGCCTPL